jgi:hypothetical protein
VKLEVRSYETDITLFKNFNLKFKNENIMFDSAVCLFSRMTTDTYQHSLCSYELDCDELAWIWLDLIGLKWEEFRAMTQNCYGTFTVTEHLLLRNVYGCLDPVLWMGVGVSPRSSGWC